MNNFKDGGFKRHGKDFGGHAKFGGSKRTGGKFAGGNDRGNRGGERAEMFTATCSTCQKSCEVPFRPSADKPVYCSACFGKKSSDELRGNYDGARNEVRSRSDFRPERPSFTKPQREYAPASGQKNIELEGVIRQLATIESRLNRILDLISPPIAPVKVVKVSAVIGDEEIVVLPKKIRKPKTVKTKTATGKKVAKKATKK